MSITIQTSNITAISVLVYLDDDGAGAGPNAFTLYASDGTTVIENVSAGDSRWSASDITLAGLTPGTSYVIKLDSDTSITAEFTTLPDTPRTATVSQWVSLADAVKAKANASDVPQTYWGRPASSGAVSGNITLGPTNYLKSVDSSTNKTTCMIGTNSGEFFVANRELNDNLTNIMYVTGANASGTDQPYGLNIRRLNEPTITQGASVVSTAAYVNSQCSSVMSPFPNSIFNQIIGA